MHIEEKLSLAFYAGDIKTVDKIFKEYPRLKERRVYLGGDWLYFAAAQSTIDMVKYLIELGFDPHAKAKQEGDNVLCNAASDGRADMVEFLLGLGVEIDTSLSVRNPLISAVVANRGRIGPRGEFYTVKIEAEKIIRLLFEHGIDASIEYRSPGMNRLNAAGFALWNQKPELAELICELQAEHGKDTFDYYMQKAIAGRNRQKRKSPYKTFIEER